jgi:hypothetical protein
MEANDPIVAASENALRQALRAQRDLADLSASPHDYGEVAAPLAEIALLLETVNQRLTRLHDSKDSATRGKDS